MNSFRILTIADKRQMNSILLQAPWTESYLSSEYVFENLFAWNFTESIEILWCGHWAILRSLLKGKRVYLPPVASTVNDFMLCMDKIHELDPSAVIVGLTEKMLPMVNQPHQFILYDDVLSEYIYLSKEMIELKGSKFHRKRNQLSQFMKKYQYALTDYQKTNRLQVLDFLDRYKNQGGTAEDRNAILHTLDNMSHLDTFADLLWVDDVLVGLSIGVISIFNHGVHLFEKADIQYTGSYAALIHLVYAKRYASVPFVSRQEDLGLPELRKAKMSYYPVQKEKKYVCTLDPELRQFHELYMECFNDSKEYVDFFFLHQANREHAIGFKKDEQLVSGLHLISKSLFFNHQAWDTQFIVAAATKKAYRRQGLMKKVMATAFKQSYDQGYSFLSLFPVSQNYYAPYGFMTYTYTEPIGDEREKRICTLEQTVSASILSSLYKQSVEQYEGYMIRSESWWLQFMNSLYQDQYEFSLIKDDEETIGYLAHKSSEIDELCLIKNVLPVVPGYDFSKYQVPSMNHQQPGNMIRIIHLKKFLERFNPSSRFTIEIKIKFTDDMIAENNCMLKITADHGMIKYEDSTVYDLELTMTEFTDLVFTGNGPKELMCFSPEKKMISYDQF